MSAIACTRLTLFTAAAVFIQIVGLLLFVFGFFPVKPALSGVSGPESFLSPFCDSVENGGDTALPPDQLRSLYQKLSGVPPSFDRLILMVIDGLPAEFVLGKDDQPPKKFLRDAMPYTQSLLAKGMAIGYHAKAAPPTVTMPRLKALVSGAIGGFLDVAFNFNTQALLDDNLLDQFSRIGWKMVMLGDETWLKLFPGLFTRHDGVSSFYVKDTVQVDQNVSRHLTKELGGDDWNLLILHYLGLDHVGHIGGRNSELMVPKLTEMDEVVRMIHSSIIQASENGQGKTLLMVVSDHGMTDNGNHGGSSYEETDSIVLLIGLRNNVSDCAKLTSNAAYQVDITPTLALLFGVPIPKNNVGVLISEAIDSLQDDQKMRALELNSWQLLRLLQAQLPGLLHGNSLCNGYGNDQESDISNCHGSTEAQLCCLYMKAAVLHSSWKSKKVSRSDTREDQNNIIVAYYEFLNTASEWLSHKTTDKPVNLLGFGVATMLLSCLILLSLILCLCREVYPGVKRHLPNLIGKDRASLEEIFMLGAVLLLVLSMGSSSMVEEEHYIWYFLISTFYLLLLRKTAQSLTFFKEQNGKSDFQICSVFVLLISGRILRGWHQGGVNWTNLPDISKWLEHCGSDYIKLIQLVSALLLIGFGFFALRLMGSKGYIVRVVGISFLVPGFLVLLHVMEYQDNMFASSNYGATLLAQMIYAFLAVSTIGTVVALPWLMPFASSKVSSSSNSLLPPSVSVDIEGMSLLMEIRASLYVIGCAYISCWCLLQLLLQQPINSVPILLLLAQISAGMLYFSFRELYLREWVEVAMLHYLGMAGHFALGNSNTLATIDVAAAFMGISSHSTLLSGILMFIITYASPMLMLLSLVMYISVKSTSFFPIAQNANSEYLLKMMLGFPCLVPLGINSILLTAYTVVLLLMRNHLFVWSVFSPKYLYVCATTVCTYLGVCIVAVTGTYTYLVLALRKRKQVSVVR